MKYFYFVCAALCGLLAVCSLLSLTCIVGISLSVRDLVIGILGASVGTYLGMQIQRDENRDGPMSGRLR
ncbi:MAG: hypothetical protein IKV72_07850 [Firmicutes bacterium]|nr:hypothetical protein [Bacillota bacterium]